MIGLQFNYYSQIINRHCEPTGPARSGRPDDRLREAIHFRSEELDCFVALRAPRMTILGSTQNHHVLAPPEQPLDVHEL
jgi:hypothetical protein